MRLALPRELIRHEDTVSLVWDGGQKFPLALLSRMADPHHAALTTAQHDLLHVHFRVTRLSLPASSPIEHFLNLASSVPISHTSRNPTLTP